MGITDTVLNGEQIDEIWKQEGMKPLRPRRDRPLSDSLFRFVSEITRAQAESTWNAREPEIAAARKAGFDEGVKRTLAAADSTFGALLEQIRRGVEGKERDAKR